VLRKDAWKWYDVVHEVGAHMPPLSSWDIASLRFVVGLSRCHQMWAHQMLIYNIREWLRGHEEIRGCDGSVAR
jgi:hypothetical protein